MNLFDSFVIDGVRKTSDGYLAAFARVARTGVQLYKGSELGRPDLDTVRVYRPPEEVFHADALKSFAHRPITLRHPSAPVNAKNWKKYSGGQTGDEVVRDGEFVRVPMVMMDQKLIDAYEKDGIKELSMGYSTDIQWRAGVTDSGEPYDAVQTAIRGNHLAVVPVARGGDQLRIGDEDLDDAWSEAARAAALEARRLKAKNQSHEHLHNTIAEGAPTTVEHEGKTYRRTGKIGTHHKTGEYSAEYKHKNHEGEHRVWHTTSGKTVRDADITDSSFLDDENCPKCGASMSGKSCSTCNYVKDGEYTMKLVIDGLTVNVADDQSGGIIERHIATLTRQLADANSNFENFKKKKEEDDKEMQDAKKVIETKDGEIAVLKKQVEDAKITPEKLDVLVKDRMAVVDKAKTLLDAKYVFDGKTVEVIRKDAVIAKLGDDAKTMSDGAIEGAFAALTKDAKIVTADAQIADALRSRPHSTTTRSDARDAAYAENIKHLENNWKTPAA